MDSVERTAVGTGSLGRLAVVGSGAVGLYYGGCLARWGAEVHFLMRRDYAHAVERGIAVESALGNFEIRPAHCHREAGTIGACDLVIVAAKATANRDLPPQVAPLLGPGTAILTLQNGLGNEEWLASHFGAPRVMGGTCFVCLNRVGPARVAHYDHGLVVLGEFAGAATGRARALAEAFRRAGVPCEVTDDLALTRWKKLVWNVPFNGLAISEGGATVEDVLGDPALLARARALMGEVIASAGALGHAIQAGFAEEMVARSRTMGPYRPSSLLDYEAGRDVEVEAIWGEALRRGRGAGVAMPELERLYGKLKELCRGPKVAG
ncbi:MAG: 2-dehydropantoate 2-reductase [Verrucomicrobiae bacterium]|nr:2-dehydropantoate 2-reductase [Verrucomicrobiae bacterium]